MKKLWNNFLNFLDNTRKEIYASSSPDTIISLLIGVLITVGFIAFFGWYHFLTSIIYVVGILIAVAIYFNFDDNHPA